MTSRPDPTLSHACCAVAQHFFTRVSDISVDSDDARRELVQDLLARLLPTVVPTESLMALARFRCPGLRHIEASIGAANGQAARDGWDDAAMVTHVIEQQQPVIVFDIGQWPRQLPGFRSPTGALQNEGAYFHFPLSVTGFGTMGTLLIMTDRRLQDEPSLRADLAHVVDHIATTVHLIALQARSQVEQAVIREILKSTTAADPREAVAAIEKGIRQVLGAEQAAVFLRDSHSGRLELGDSSMIIGGAFQNDPALRRLAESVFDTGKIHEPATATPNGADIESAAAAAYCAPLRAEGNPIGVLLVDGIDDALSGFDQQFLETLTLTASVALQHILAHDESNIQRAIREATIQFQQIISDLLPLTEQFRQIREALSGLFDLSTEGLFIAFYDPGSQIVHFPKVRHKDTLIREGSPHAVRQLYTSRRLHQVKGLVDWVIARNRAIYFDDFQAQAREMGIDTTVGECVGVQSCIVAPMNRGDKMRGVIGLRSYSRRAEFSQHDFQFLQHVGPIIGTVIDNSEWLDRDTRAHLARMAELSLQRNLVELQNDISDILTTTEQLRQIRQAVAAQGIDTRGFFLAEYEAESGLITWPKVYVRGRKLDETDIRSGSPYSPRRLGERRGLVDYSIRTGESLLIENVDEDLNIDEIDADLLQGVTCLLVVPLALDDRIIGAIGLLNHERYGIFTSADQRLLEEAAHDIATVLNNSKKFDSVRAESEDLTEKLRQRVRELNAVIKFQRRISRIAVSEEEQQPTDVTEIDGATPVSTSPNIVRRELNNIYEIALSGLVDVGFDTRNMYIALFDENSNKVSFPLIYENGKPVADSESRPAYRTRALGERPDLTEYVIRQGMPLQFGSRDQMTAWARRQPDSYTLPQYSQSWVGAPMKLRNRTVGMIGLRSFEKRNMYTRDHRRMLDIIARQAAIVIDNAALYQRSRNQLMRLEALVAAGSSISKAGLSIGDVLQSILRQAQKVTGAYLATLHKLEEDSLQLLASWPPQYGAILAEKADNIPKQGAGIIALTARKNRYTLIPDVTQHSHFLDFGVDPAISTRSELAVALRSAEPGPHNVIGVLNVEHHLPDGLDRDHAHLLIALSNLATAAIQNAEQHEALQDAYRDLRKTKERADASHIVAFTGLFAADWQHTIHQHTFALEGWVEEIAGTLRDAEVNPDNALTLETGLAGIRKVVERIRDVQFMSNVPSELPDESDYDLEIDTALERLVNEWVVSFPEINLDFELNCHDTRVSIAEEWLTIAIEKLISNAIRSMDEQGRISIRTECRKKIVHIYVADTGRGIPDYARDTFLKAVVKRPVGVRRPSGTGKGGMIARYIALSHGGELSLVATRPQYPGTKLLMTLPVRQRKRR